MPRKIARILMQITRLLERSEMSEEARNLVGGICADAARRVRRMQKLAPDQDLGSGKLLQENLRRSLLSLMSAMKHLPHREARHIEPRLRAQITESLIGQGAADPSDWQRTADGGFKKFHDAGLPLDVSFDVLTNAWHGRIDRIPVCQASSPEGAQKELNAVAESWLRPAALALRAKRLLASPGP